MRKRQGRRSAVGLGGRDSAGQRHVHRANPPTQTVTSRGHMHATTDSQQPDPNNMAGKSIPREKSRAPCAPHLPSTAAASWRHHGGGSVAAACRRRRWHAVATGGTKSINGGGRAAAASGQAGGGTGGGDDEVRGGRSRKGGGWGPMGRPHPQGRRRGAAARKDRGATRKRTTRRRCQTRRPPQRPGRAPRGLWETKGMGGRVGGTARIRERQREGAAEYRRAGASAGARPGTAEGRQGASRSERG